MPYLKIVTETKAENEAEPYMNKKIELFSDLFLFAIVFTTPVNLLHSTVSDMHSAAGS